VPRPGFLDGAWNRLVGPEATWVETTGALVLACAGSVLGPRLAVAPAVPRSRGRDVLLRALATDLWGGAWVNNTPAAARWYERPGQGTRQHLGFAAAHLHPFVLALADRAATPRRLRWAATHYGYLLAATVVVRRTSPRYRRLAGPATTLAGVALDRRLGSSPSAPWFTPVFYVKLLTGHAAGRAVVHTGAAA
jgi:hypothetical protein